MAELSTKRRNQLPSSAFGLPKTRQYPLDSVNRAKNAKARAQQQLDKGNLSRSQYDTIVRKANRVIKTRKGLA